ncbi:MAG: hypothetical protein AAF960_07380 [Bacteroidota bacterium]
MKKLLFMCLFCLPFVFQLEGKTTSADDFGCNWNFTYSFNCGSHYKKGKNLYVKINPQKYQDIDWAELYVNNQYVRKESSYPYEWCKPNSGGDNYLRNMQPGNYTIKVKVKDKCGQYHEKKCVVYIDGGNTGSGSACNANFTYNFKCGSHYKKGKNLYVKLNPQKYQDIVWAELYINNQYVRKESSYPYEWCKPNSSGDNYLRNMQPGTYNIKVKVKDRCGKYMEKACTVYIDGGHTGGGSYCNGNFTYNFKCGSHYKKGKNLYVKINPQQYQDIEWAELYINNQYVRKESSYPYEWCKPNSSGDNYLKNMQAGTYNIKVKLKDKCGKYHEKACTVYIDGGHNGGGHTNACIWDAGYQYPNQQYYPKGTNLYVKVNPQKYQDIEWMELRVNNQYIRKETSYPYEWCKPNSSGDNYLRNMQPGTYVLKCKYKTKCGKYYEKKQTIYVQN